MRTFYFVLIFLAVLGSIFVQRGSRPMAKDSGYLAPQTLADSEIGIAPYPQATYLPEATNRLLEGKASNWLLVRVYQTDDSIKDVAKHFKAQAHEGNKPAQTNPLLESLLRDNWKIIATTVSGSLSVFGAGKELRRAPAVVEAEIVFGIIVLDDSIVRVHLMSPHPAATDNNKLSSGTMIVLVRERLTQPTDIAAESGTGNEKIYMGREVTRRARVKKKPKPQYVSPGIGGAVVLRVVFTAAGEVTNISVVSSLPGGLTEASIEAARKIKFEPAIKDGRYVSTYVQLEYHFHN